MRRNAYVAGVVALMLTLACDTQPSTDNLAPTEIPASPEAAIIDGNSTGASYFRFVPPTVTAGTPLPAPNDKKLYPEISICELANGACVAEIWSFRRDHKQKTRLLKASTTYEAEWVTALNNLDPARFYRVNVTIDGRVIGYADVDVVATADELAGVDRANYLGVIRDSNVTLAFWIREGVFSHIISKHGGRVIANTGLLRMEIAKGSIPDMHIGALPGPAPAGALIVPGTYYELFPAELQFSKPAQLTIMLTEKWVPKTIPIADLRMLRYRDGVWSEVPGAIVELNKHRVYADVTELGNFAVGKLTEAPQPDPLSLSSAAVPSSVLRSQPLNMEVYFRRSNGDVATDINSPVAATLNTSSGAIALGSVTAAAGRAVFNITLPQPGYNNTITFSATGASAFTTNPFTIAEVPPVPINLAVTSSQVDRLGVAFDGVTQIFGTNPSYELRFGVPGGAQTTRVVAHSAADAHVTDVIPSLAPNTAYQIDARACIAEGCSSASSTVAGTTLPRAVTTFTGTWAPAGVTLAVTDVQSGVPVTYNFYRGDTLVCDNSGVSCLDSGISLGATYAYTVEACNVSGCGARSPVVSVTTPGLPGAPANLAVVSSQIDQITVSFPAVNFTNANPRYEVRYRVDPAGAYSQLMVVPAPVAGVQSVELTGLAAGTLYDVDARSCDDVGCSTFSSEVSGWTLPRAPVNLRTGAITSGGATVLWDAQVMSNGASPSYEVYIQPNGGARLLVTTVNANTFTYSGLNPGAQYTSEIAACNPGGCTPAQVNFTTLPLTPPIAPTRLQINGQTFTAITLGWNDNSNNESAFNVYRFVQPSSTFMLVATLPAGTNTYIDTNVIQGQGIAYRVDAVNSAGQSASNVTSTIVPTGQTERMATYVTPLNQTGAAGAAATYPPRVRLVLTTGSPAVNVPVTFTISSAGSSFGALTPRVTTAVVNTNSQGIATAPSWILEAGVSTVVTSAVGYNSVMFNATAN